jgi:hypothetical protein
MYTLVHPLELDNNKFRCGLSFFSLNYSVIKLWIFLVQVTCPNISVTLIRDGEPLVREMMYSSI